MNKTPPSNRFGVHHLAQLLDDRIRELRPAEQLVRGYIDFEGTLHTEGGALSFPRGHYDSLIDIDQVAGGDSVIVAYLLGQEAVIIGKSYRDSPSTKKTPHDPVRTYSGVVKAVDTSTALTTPWLKACWDLGIRLVSVPGVASPPNGALNAHLFSDVAAALDFGMAIGVYVRPPTRWEDVLNDLAPAGQEDLTAKIEWLALDVEPEVGGPFPVTQAHIDGVVARGVQPIVYSGYGVWPGIMGQSTAFSDLPLWDTDASNNNGQYTAANFPASMTARKQTPFGGWTDRFGWQCAFNVEFPTGSGVICDLDLFFLAGKGIWWPFPGVDGTDWEITTFYGHDDSYQGNKERFHHGLDIITKRSPRLVYAVAAGTVSQTETGVTGQTSSVGGWF